MPPCLVTGEAAGMAAVHAIKQTKNDVHKIDVGFSTQKIKRRGAIFLINTLGMNFYGMFLLTNPFKCCIFIVWKELKPCK